MSDRAKILLVDDRVENLLALEAILSPLDQTLVRAASGEEALRALLKDDFALILLDAQMPGMDGFETAARIKRRTRTKDIPIIFLTAFGDDPHSSYQGYLAGAADYLSKPFDPWVLRAKVQVFVDLWQGRHRAAPEQDGAAAMGGAAQEPLAALVEAVQRLRAALPEDSPARPSVEEVGRRTEELRLALEGEAAPARPPASRR